MGTESHTTPPDAAGGLKIPATHWDDLEERLPEDICRKSMAVLHPNGVYALRFLNREILVDTQNRQLWKDMPGAAPEKINDPLLTLILLVYLRDAAEIEPENVIAAPQELREGHFFTGVHALDVEGVVKRFGHDPEGFSRAAEAVGGTRESYADVSYRFSALPRIPIYYLLWEGDEEFPPNLTVCFDRTIERHLAADAIWGLVKQVSRELLRVAA